MSTTNIYGSAVWFLAIGVAACTSSPTGGGGASTTNAGSGGATAAGSGGQMPGGTGGGGAGTAGVTTGGSPSGGSSGAAGGGMGGSSGIAGSSGADASGGAAGSGGSAGSGGGAGGGGTQPCAGAGTLKSGNSSHMLTVGGTNYPMNVHAPPGYDGVTRMPVVFDFHGLGGDENQMQRLSGWAATGDREGFITVFPGGPDNGWNAGGCCTDTPTDLDFVRQAITYLDGTGCIDTKRVYASGCSNGGAMSYRLACEAADVIAAVAPVDFDCVAGGFGCMNCNPSRPITVVQFRGTNDSAVPYGSETSGARANFANWREINMCTGPTAALPENSSCQAHSMCADGVQTILCSVQNGPHCGSYMSFGIANLAWSIISQYSLP